MAIITRQLARMGGGVCIFEFDYDDVELLIAAIRCINNGDYPAWGMATCLATDKTYDATFPANKTTEISLPTSISDRLDITIREDGKIDGVDYRVKYPA